MGSANYYVRCRDAWRRHRQSVVEPLFREVLLAWLKTLPREGWCGTNTELWSALTAAKETHNLRGEVPVAAAGLTRSVKAAAPMLHEAKWDVTFPRTNSARLIAFTRVRRKRTSTAEGR